MALKFPNVFLGTGAYPPRHWPTPVRRLPARSRARQGGVRHQLPDRRPPPRARAGRRARPRPPRSRPTSSAATRAPRVHATRADRSDDMIGKVYSIPPQPPVEEQTHRRSPRARSRSASSTATLDPESLRETYAGNAAQLAELEARSPEGGFTDEGVSIHVCGHRRRARVPALRRVRRRASLPLRPPPAPPARS